MIIGLLLSTILVFINFVFGLLPIADLPSGVITGINAFFASVYQFNSVFPIDTAITLLVFTAGFWAVIFLWDFFRWLIHLIRGN